MQARARTASVYLVSPIFDYTFFVFTALVVLGPWIAAERFHVAPFLILAVVGIVSNGPHLVSTWTRVYLDGNERWRRPVHYFLVPALIAAAVVSLTLVQGLHTRILRTVLLYWAIWHFVAQNWGILRIYQRRAGEADAPIARLERAVLYLGALWPLLHRLFTGPWSLFGAKIYYPPLEPWMVNGVGVVLAATAAVYLVLRIVQARRGRPVELIRPLFLVSSWFGFFVPLVLIRSNGTAAFAAAACWHGLQYIGIVWCFNRSRWKDGVDERARLVSWISQPGRVVPYFLTLLAIAGVAYGAIKVLALVALNVETWGQIVWMSLTFGHYYLDGVIWKLRRPELAKHLIGRPQPMAA